MLNQHQHISFFRQHINEGKFILAAVVAFMCLSLGLKAAPGVSGLPQQNLSLEITCKVSGMIEPKIGWTNDQWVNAYFSPAPISDVYELGDDEFAVACASRGPILRLAAAVNSNQARSLTWFLNGHSWGKGAHKSLTVLGPQTYKIEVGFPGGAMKSLTLHCFDVAVETVGEYKKIPVGVPVTFRATTNPPGYEDYVSWLSATKHGSVSPAIGQGSEFTVTFQNVEDDKGIAWYGVRGESALAGSDTGGGGGSDPGKSGTNNTKGQKGNGQNPSDSSKTQSPPGGKKPGSGCNVLLHTGQEEREVVDYFLPGIEPRLNVVIKRKHVSRNLYPDSWFGAAWACNYQHYLKEQPDGTLLIESYERKDTYHPVPAQEGNLEYWESEEDRFELIRFEDDVFVKRYPRGIEEVYLVEGEAGSREGILKEIRTPNGNRVQFVYEMGNPLKKKKLLWIIDSYGRSIDLLYTEASGGHIASIRDFSGRELRYTYDLTTSPVCNFLVERSSPRVNNKGIGPGFPLGKREHYRYYWQENPPADPDSPTATEQTVLDRIGCSLVELTRPNEVEKGLEISKCRWTYYDDPEGNHFGYVATEEIGNTSAAAQAQGLQAGGTFTYNYEDVDTSTEAYQSVAGSVNAPWLIATVTDRRGFEYRYDMNELGYVLEEQLIEDENTYIVNYEYNSDLREICDNKETTATTDKVYESGNRLVKDNITSVCHSPDDRGGDQDHIATEYVYEPIFNKVFKYTDPRGFVTTYITDYMEDNLNDVAIEFAPKINMKVADLLQLFIDKEITSMGDVNGDGAVDQHCGNTIQVIYPDVQLPEEVTEFSVFSSLTQEADETFQYNSRGQKTQHIDAEENVFSWEYFGFNDPEGDLSSASGDGGFLKKITRDVGGVAQTWEYRYNGEGVRGMWTTMTDPRGIRTTRVINELDQEIQRTLAAFVSPDADPKIVGGSFSYRRQQIYDANDNLIEQRIEDLDPVHDLTFPGTFISNKFLYDILDNKIAESFQVSPTKSILNLYQYDEDELLTLEIYGAGSSAQKMVSNTYSAQKLLAMRAEGFGTLDMAITLYGYDYSRALVDIFDPQGADHTKLKRDGYLRDIGVLDPEGNETTKHYDASGNVVTIVRQGPAFKDGPLDQELSRERFHYDERDRMDVWDREIFHTPNQSVGTIADGGTAGGNIEPGDGKVTEVNVYDKLGRLVAEVDAEEDLTTYTYDGLSRLTQVTDPLSNQSLFTYDAADNLLTEEEREKASSSGLVVSDEVFVTERRYDALNRLAMLTEPNGQVTTHTYDSRHNLVRTVDGETNEIIYNFDDFDRPTTETVVLKDSEDIVTTQIWDDVNRVKKRIDGEGQETVYRYDELDRTTRIDYQDETFEEWTYNRDSVAINHTDQNGTFIEYDYDLKNRLTEVKVMPATDVIGTTRQTFTYDGLDRVISQTDTTLLTGDVTVTKIFDSLSRVIRETQQIEGGLASLPGDVHSIDYEYTGLTRKTQCTYPNGRVIAAEFDALDRQKQISDSTGVICSMDYVGPHRDLLVVHGNGSVLDKRNAAKTQSHTGFGAGYDQNRRSLHHEWTTSGGSPITTYINSYNQANMRLEEQREHLGRGDKYTLDSAYRLVQFDRDATLSGGVLIPVAGQESVWTLDTANNWTGYVKQGNDQSPVVDTGAGVNEYLSFAGDDLAYDANGNLKQAGDIEYFYDFLNRLVFVRRASDLEQIALYTYDAMNRRVLRNVVADSSRTQYLYSDWNVIEELDQSRDENVTERQYVCREGLDRPIQLGVFTSGQIEPNEVYYYHGNFQGSVGALTDAGEHVVEHYEYDSYGERRILGSDKVTPLADSQVGNPYFFHARRFDAETGFYYFRNRYQDPVRGRFIQQDPVGQWYDRYCFGNRYCFTGNRPWDFSDPEGNYISLFIKIGKAIYKAYKKFKPKPKPKTKGLEKQLKEHKKKLSDYKKSPDAHDNKGLLKNASPEQRKRITEGREKSLQKQIDNFKKQIKDKKSGKQSDSGSGNQKGNKSGSDGSNKGFSGGGGRRNNSGGRGNTKNKAKNNPFADPEPPKPGC